jgi:tetratricopeptide (TPR) repeat protein
MSNPPTLFHRLKQARIVRVAAVYLGASWVLLQVASTVVEAFKLPDWVLPTAIILLLVGLMVILATAWVQSLASTTEGEEAGHLPTDWQIAPRDALASLRRGRLPHLTWGRTLAAGVFVMALLFGGAGTYVGFIRDRGIGPREADASEAAEGIAVVPFEVRGGKELEIWREGMMDLLTNGLDGVGGFRTIDSRTLMARWRDNVPADAAPDLSMTLKVAKAAGARYALEGSVVALGPAVRLSANVYDVDTGMEIARGQREGPAEDVLRLVDELAVEIMRDLLTKIGRAGAADESAETITTTSLPALREYLVGEKHYRRGQFAAAVESYEKAIAADSTFAIALVHLSEAYGWLETESSKRMFEVGERAIKQKHRLSPRYQFIMTGWDALNHGSPAGIASLKEAVRKYPDDPRAWFLLAETYIHVGGPTYGTRDEIWTALQRAITLDPGFAPYYVHVAEYAVLRGDSALARKSVERYRTLAGDSLAGRYIEIAIAAILGTDQQAANAMHVAASLPPGDLDTYGGAFARKHDRLDRDASLDSIWAVTSSQNRKSFEAYYAGAQGALKRGQAITEDPSMNAASRSVYFAYVNELWNVEPPAGAITPDACKPENFACVMIVGTGLANLGRWAEQQQIITRVREASKAAADTVAARRLLAAAEVLSAVAMKRRGDAEGARAIFTRHIMATGLTGERVRLELAWLEAEAKRPSEALRHFKSVEESFLRPIALYGEARMYEQMKDVEQARAHWARFSTLTAKGDASLPRIAEVRAALARGGRDR